MLVDIYLQNCVLSSVFEFDLAWFESCSAKCECKPYPRAPRVGGLEAGGVIDAGGWALPLSRSPALPLSPVWWLAPLSAGCLRSTVYGSLWLSGAGALGYIGVYWGPLRHIYVCTLDLVLYSTVRYYPP
jgi:hypothetical protein